MTSTLLDRLRALTAIAGIAGHEDAITRHMADHLSARADAVEIDSLGNVIARFGPPESGGPAVCAHMDTVGLMVKRILPDGTLGVIPVGGANLKSLPGAAVRAGNLPAVIGVRSQHQARPGDEGVTDADQLYAHAGEGVTVEITTPITYAPNPIELAGGLFASPYLDDRAGCAVLLELADHLAGRRAGTVHLIGTVQEETTGAGAFHALQRAAPTAALFVDGTVSYDTPDTRGRGDVRLGGGPVLTSFLYVRGLNGWHAHPGLRGHLKEIARGAGIPFQQDAVHGLMADAGVALWLGLPSALIGLPMRGKHSPTEIIHLTDLEHSVRLLLAALEQPLPDLKRG